MMREGDLKLQPLLITRREAAEALGLSVRAIDYLVQQGRLRSRKLGKRRLFPREEVERFAKRDCARIVPAPKGRDGH